MKVAIQGIAGSYHHQAAQQLFGDVDLLECHSFNDLAIQVATGTATTGVMAIGNSIAGTIVPNYSLVLTHQLAFSGELYLPIAHALMALAGQSTSQLTEVQSHPMALLQCQTFFENYPHIKLVETDDTAAAAMRIAHNKIKGVAAIAGIQAARLYGLELLATNIQDTVHNHTRFVVVNKKQGFSAYQLATANKATLNLVTHHKVGSLAAVLQVLATMQLNLSKIQSVPIVEKPFLFSFIIEVEFEDLSIFFKAQEKLETMVQSLEIIGIYKKATL